MAKYRPIDVRLWDDRKFLSLSDDGRMLWLFLLTSPYTSPIPGVIIAGQAAIAELLGWTTERLGERFGELFRAGLAIAIEGRIVWLKRGLKYQPPANPNVVKGWSKVWDDVPEGDLKHELWQALKVACKSYDRTFAKLFPEPFRDGSPNGLGNGSPNGLGNGSTQDQEQDQEQEREEGPAAAPLPGKPKSPPPELPEPAQKTVPQNARALRGTPEQRAIAMRAWEAAATEHSRLKARGIGATARPWVMMPDLSGAPFDALVERVAELATNAAERVNHRIAIASVEAQELGHLDYFTPALLWRRDGFYVAEGMSIEAARARARAKRPGGQGPVGASGRRLATFNADGSDV